MGRTAACRGGPAARGTGKGGQLPPAPLPVANRDARSEAEPVAFADPPGASAAGLKQVAFLSASEAAAARESILALRERWTPRDGLPFFTLGAASYLDARQGFTAYQRAARHTNPLLAEHFGWLHDRLCGALAAIVGGSVRCDSRLGLPGFHVFLYDPTRPFPPASVHFDMQYELIDWTSIGHPDISSQLSITVALALPAAGGGLLTWNLNRLDLAGLSDRAVRARTRLHRRPAFHPYSVGQLAVHSGHQLHQIAAARDPRLGDERITLQAHALPVNGRWLVYW